MGYSLSSEKDSNTRFPLGELRATRGISCGGANRGEMFPPFRAA